VPGLGRALGGNRDRDRRSSRRFSGKALEVEVDLLVVVHAGEENLLARYGGAELWRTADGIHWKPVTRSGFGNKYNWGIRTLQSTPHGLFVGTVNPYGPKVAVKRGKRWSYVYNPRGGCEVWLGSSTHD